MLHRISVLKDAQKACPDFMSVVTLMKTMEIVPSSFPMRPAVVAHLQKCCDEAAQVAVSMPMTHVVAGGDMVIDTQANKGEAGDLNAPYKAHCVTSLNKCIIEHNVRVLSKYYAEIRTARAAEMLGLSVDELELHLADMAQPAVHVTGKSTANTTEDEEAGFGGTSLYIRINRPDGIVSFSAPKTAESTLSDWASDITGLFNLMETTCHLINREHMVYKV